MMSSNSSMKSIIIVISIVSSVYLREVSSLPSSYSDNDKLCPHRCGSGECITLDKLCDGVAHCADGSDETKAQCEDIYCPGYAFRCNYGACISSEVICDGTNDCVDGSDEQKWLCTAQMMQGNCNNWEIRCSSGQCVPFSRLCDGQMDCFDGDDESESLCGVAENKTHQVISDNASTEEPINLSIQEEPNKVAYQKVAPPLSSGSTKIPEVHIAGCFVPNLQNLLVKNKFNELLQGGILAENGANIYFSCQMNHKLIGESNNYCENGVWHQEFPYCQKPLELAFILVVTLLATLCVVMMYMIYRLQRDWRQPKDRVWYVGTAEATRSSFIIEEAASSAAATTESQSRTSK